MCWPRTKDWSLPEPIIVKFAVAICRHRPIATYMKLHGTFNVIWSNLLLVSVYVQRIQCITFLSWRQCLTYDRDVVTAIYVSVTSVDHPGWPAAVSFAMFAQWLILSCLVTSNGVVFVSGLTNWGRDKMAAVFQTTFSNAFSSMKMFEFWLKFHWSLFLSVQLTIFQHWFR